MKAKKISQTLNEANYPKRYTFKYIEENYLGPLAERLGEELRYVKRGTDKQLGKKVLKRFYSIGPVKILAKETKVPGDEPQDVDIVVLNSKDQSKGKKFDAASEFIGLFDEIKDQYYELTGKEIYNEETPLYDNEKTRLRRKNLKKIYK